MVIQTETIDSIEQLREARRVAGDFTPVPASTGTHVEKLTGEAGLQQMNLLAMTMPGKVRAYDKRRFMGKNATAKLQRAQAKRRKKGKKAYHP